jgi:hypothetical protein
MNVDREAIKALVLLHGQRKAARISGLNENTVKAWARRGKWKSPLATERHSDKSPLITHPMRTQSPLSIVEEHLTELRSRSTVALARYSAEASEEAAQRQDKLNVARKVRDVASVHSTLWPAEKDSASILQIGVLIGKDALPEPDSQR